jgi:hypothetical protein
MFADRADALQPYSGAMLHAAIHPLTPGSPAYAIAKVGAIGGLIALRVALSRRSKRSEPESAAEAPAAAERPAQAHPVSARKARRRSRKRR